MSPVHSEPESEPELEPESEPEPRSQADDRLPNWSLWYRRDRLRDDDDDATCALIGCSTRRRQKNFEATAILEFKIVNPVR